MSKKSEFILDGLNKLIPNPRCELEFNKDYELLLAVMLSAQTTDKRVNMVTSELFKKYDTLEKLQTLTIPEIEEQIKTIGMYKTKARNFKKIVNDLIKIGYVPNDREVLESMSGVGRKTTNVVLSVLYNEPLIAVDTHVDRVSKRLGLAKENDTVIDVENKLKKAFPKNTWTRLHQQLVLFGRYTCKSKNPECNICPFKDICKYYKNVVKK